MSSNSFADAEVQKCPFPLIRYLHREAPVYRDPITGFWVVSRYRDIDYVSQHPELFSNTTAVVMDKSDSPVAAQVAARFEADGFLPMHTLVTNDPPSHAHFRALVDKVFTPRSVRALEPRISELVDELIDDIQTQVAVDIHQCFSVKLPIYVIAEQLGIDRADWKKIKLWSDVSVENINPMIAPERELEITEHIIEMQQYLWRNAQRYREAPGDTLLSQLVHAEIDGEKLEARALMSIAHQLLVAGNESTSGALSSGILMMLQDKALQQRLVDSPALIGNFVEEVLRHHSPSPHLYRQVKQDTRIGDVELKKDEVVMISYLAANHDPLVFDAPEAVCLDRQNSRKHMAFGRGIHFCIGNQLARAEMRIAFSQLLHRLPGMRLDPGAAEPDFAPLFHVHSLDRLPVLLKEDFS